MKTSELAANVRLDHLGYDLKSILSRPLTHQCYIFACLLRREPATERHPAYAKWAEDNESAISGLPKDLDLTQPPDAEDDPEP